MTINIIEAIEAMERGEVVKCIKNNTFYRKSDIPNSFESSEDSTFNHAELRNYFTISQIQSQWEIAHKIRHCIFCDNKVNLRIHVLSHLATIECPRCEYSSPKSSIEEAIKIHNRIYENLHQILNA